MEYLNKNNKKIFIEQIKRIKKTCQNFGGIKNCTKRK